MILPQPLVRRNVAEEVIWLLDCILRRDDDNQFALPASFAARRAE